MNKKFEIIHTVIKQTLDENPQWNMPYAPAIKVLSGKPLYISGVNAAPIYHNHPHEVAEFNNINFDPENQAKLTMENLKTIIESSGGTLNDIVQLIVFIVNIKKNGEYINKIFSHYFGKHLCAMTVVGIENLITDPRLIVEATAVAYID